MLCSLLAVLFCHIWAQLCTIGRDCLLRIDTSTMGTQPIGLQANVPTYPNLPTPSSIFVEGSVLFAADPANGRIAVMQLDATGIKTTDLRSTGRGFSMVDGLVTRATFSDPQAIAVGPNGDIFVAGEQALCSACWQATTPHC